MPRRTTSLTRRAAAPVAGVALLALLAGCGSAPSDTPSGNAGSADGSDVVPCLVSDSGGFDDKSFNQDALAGITEAADEIGVDPITVESNSDTDYAPNIATLIDQGCTIVISVGFLLADATRVAAEDHPEVQFAIIDDDSIDLPNVRPITFDASQPSFLAGYAAASYSTTGVVGTFGGVQFPAVTSFMDGFAYGVDYYNEQNGTSVSTVGWDPATQVGVFTGGFVAGPAAKSVAQGIIDQDADVIYPVGGPIFQSAGEAIRDANREIAMVGVDVDLYVTAPELKDLFLTSVLRQVAAGVKDSVLASADGTFSNEPYLGTLANEGVDIAPWHDFESKISAALPGELDTIRAGIIDGSIPTAPAAK